MSLREKFCDCGCGETFVAVRHGEYDKRFASDACRARHHAGKVRYIAGKRPRSTRAHHGAEFQLSPEDIAYIARVRDAHGFKDGSQAMRFLLRKVRSAVDV